MSSLRKRLLERIESLADRGGARHDRLPGPPTPLHPREAAGRVMASGRDDRDEFAHLLLAVDRAGEPGRLAEAEQLLLRAEPRLWFRLDVATRRSWWHAPGWSAAAAERVVTGAPTLLGLVVASFHPDGYIREATVARLAERTDLLAAIPLALRTADWVAQVRDRARLALQRRLADAPDVTLMAVGPVALAMQVRREGGWLAEQVQALLRAGPAAAPEAALTASDWRLRRAAYASAVAQGRLELPQLLAAATHDSDLPTRVRCAEAAVAAAVAAGTVDAVRPLLASRTAAVRAEVVHALARGGDLGPASSALSDRAPIVRAVAQAAIRRAGSDPAESYRRLVAKGPPDPADLAGLGETGGSLDANLIRPWLTHPLPRGRAAAVRALHRFGAASPHIVGSLLSDPSGAVTRQVTAALRPWVAQLDLGHLQSLLAAANPDHVRRAAYRLLHERDTWARLLADLELLADQSSPLRHQARNDLRTWLAQEAATAYSRPPDHVAVELDGRLQQAETILGHDQVRLLRFHLGLSSA